MVIIIEGPDNVGKGTQIELLEQYFNSQNIPTTIIHCHNFKNASEPRIISERCYKSIMHTINAFKTNDSVLILDRSHLGETVYAPMYRMYSGDYVYELENLVERPETVFVFTLLDKPENLIKRDDNLSFSIDLNKKQEEIGRFEQASKFTKFHHNSHLIWNLGRTPEEIHEEIKFDLRYVKI